MRRRARRGANVRRRWPRPAVVVLVGVAGTFALPSAAAPAARASGASATIASAEWPAYLDGPLHDSFNAHEKAITVANAPGLTRAWSFSGGGGFLSSPTVVGGSVYVGANDGWLYELSAAKGTVLRRAFLGSVHVTSCPPPPTGMVSTATVAIDPHTGEPTVYASGANGYLYALNATNLALRWRSPIAIPSGTVNNYFDWSSPTVANGRIYVGVSSNCDSPLVRGGVVAYDQATGRKLAEFFTVPPRRVGGSVWSSIAVGSDGDVYASTGNGPLGSASEQLLGDSESLLKLTPTLRLVARFQVPASDEGFDTDFGASPVLFGPYVGACNKNGTFYALRQATMRLAWKRQVSGPGGGNVSCLAAPAWDGRHLYLATPAVTIGATSYLGTVQERDPDGHLVWVAGLPDGVDGSPTLDGSGVLAVGTFDDQSTPNATYLLDAASGKVLRDVTEGADFAQSVFAEGRLYVANEHGVSCWRPR